MNRQYKEYTIFDSATPVSITSSTDATPIVITATAHGFSTGDLVLIFGHTTNVAANGIYKVTRVDANSFSLQDRYTGANIVGSGAGAGANGLAVIAPKIILCQDFRNAVIHFNTAGTATLTVKVAASLGKLSGDADSHGDTPNFGATQSDTNPYTYPGIVNLEDGTQVEGDTGIAVAGADIYRAYEVNTNGLKYITLIPTAWTQGAITAKVVLYSNQ